MISATALVSSRRLRSRFNKVVRTATAARIFSTERSGNDGRGWDKQDLDLTFDAPLPADDLDYDSSLNLQGGGSSGSNDIRRQSVPGLGRDAKGTEHDATAASKANVWARSERAATALRPPEPVPTIPPQKFPPKKPHPAPQAAWAPEFNVADWSAKDQRAFQAAFDEEIRQLARQGQMLAFDPDQMLSEQEQELRQRMREVVGEWEILRLGNFLTVYKVYKFGLSSKGLKVSERRVGRESGEGGHAKIESDAEKIRLHAGTASVFGLEESSERVLKWRNEKDGHCMEWIRRKFLHNEGDPVEADAKVSSGGTLQFKSQLDRRDVLVQASNHFRDQFFNIPWVKRTPRPMKIKVSQEVAVPIQSGNILGTVAHLMAFEEVALWEERDPSDELQAFLSTYRANEMTISYVSSAPQSVQQRLVRQFKPEREDAFTDHSFAIWKTAKRYRRQLLSARQLRTRKLTKFFAKRSTLFEDELLSLYFAKDYKDGVLPDWDEVSRLLRRLIGST